MSRRHLIQQPTKQVKHQSTSPYRSLPPYIFIGSFMIVSLSNYGTYSGMMKLGAEIAPSIVIPIVLGYGLVLSCLIASWHTLHDSRALSDKEKKKIGENNWRWHNFHSPNDKGEIAFIVITGLLTGFGGYMLAADFIPLALKHESHHLRKIVKPSIASGAALLCIAIFIWTFLHFGNKNNVRIPIQQQSAPEQRQ